MIDIDPNSSGLPGIDALRLIVGAVMTFGLILSALGLIISAALHLVMVPPHAEEWRFQAGVFVVIGLGNAMAAKIPMMATTIITSISVKPDIFVG